jgi:hypothetical protein
MLQLSLDLESGFLQAGHGDNYSSSSDPIASERSSSEELAGILIILVFPVYDRHHLIDYVPRLMSSVALSLGLMSIHQMDDIAL